MRFCTTCQRMREEAGGWLKPAYKTRRWLCEDCKNRVTPSIYKGSGKGKGRGAAYIRALLEARER